MDVFLETERMVLRRFTADDVELLVELDSDPEVMRWLSGGAPTPREMIERVVLPLFMRYHWPGFGAWAAIDRENEEFLGWFSLGPSEHGAEDEAELGYRLRRKAWGHGLATEGCHALVDKAFRELGLARIFATTYEENLRSRRVMERAGLTLVRSFRITEEELSVQETHVAGEGEPWPGEDVEYAITRGQWEDSRRAPEK